MVGRYAVYSTGVAFSCRRQGDARPDISTTVAACRVDAVRSVYGADVARELLALKAVVGGCTGPEVPVNGPMGLSVEVRALLLPLALPVFMLLFWSISFA